MMTLEDIGLDFVPFDQMGLQTSELRLGTQRFGRETEQGSVEIDEKRARELLDAYEVAGGRFTDTADIYDGGMSERWIDGRLEDRDRERSTVTSGIYWRIRDDDPNSRGTNRKNVYHRVNTLLDRLDADYVDMLYIHRWDDEAPTREMTRTLNGLVENGKIHCLGASTPRPSAWKVARANEIARAEGWESLTVAQPRYNLVDHGIEGDRLKIAHSYSITICLWSPFGQGFLIGKYTREDDLISESCIAEFSRLEESYLTKENFDMHDELDAITGEVDATLTQTVFMRLIHRDGITASIVGARTVEQLIENLEATAIDLTDGQVGRLTGARPDPYVRL